MKLPSFGGTAVMSNFSIVLSVLAIKISVAALIVVWVDDRIVEACVKAVGGP